MDIVTGYKGSAHITSNDDQGRNQGIFGAGNYILNVGNKLETSINGTNGIKVKDGEAVMQGVHFRVKPGTTESLTVTLPSSGNHRQDYIIAKYTRNSSTGVENVELALLTGTAVPTANPLVAPSLTTGDILGTTTRNDMLLAIIESTNSGITSITSGEGLTGGFAYLGSLTDLTGSLASSNSDISALDARLDTAEATLNGINTSTVSTLAVSNFTLSNGATNTLRSFQFKTGIASVIYYVNGFVSGTTEKTIATLPSGVVPRYNATRVCITERGFKYTLIIRTDGTINIKPIDEQDASVPASYTDWYRETITFPTA